MTCPRCESENYVCLYDLVECWADADGFVVDVPVGYLRCSDCGHRWTDREEIDLTEYFRVE